MDWLCLHLPNEELQKGFKPRMARLGAGSNARAKGGDEYRVGGGVQAGGGKGAGGRSVTKAVGNLEVVTRDSQTKEFQMLSLSSLGFSRKEASGE